MARGSHKPKLGKRSGARAASRTSLLEWVSAAIGGLITLALIGFLVAEAVQTANGDPPMIAVRPLRLVSDGSIHLVEVEVANRTGAPAAAVEVVGELRIGDRPIESSSASLAFVPGKSKRRVGLMFERDPRRFDVAVRAGGYEEP